MTENVGTLCMNFTTNSRNFDMTNAELIAKIKAEIERRIEELNKDKYISIDAQVCRTSELNYLLRFLSTLESEKPTDLEEEINRYLHEECSDDDEPGIHEIAEHFAEWGYLRAAEKYNEIEYNRQRAEESVPNDLEEAAENPYVLNNVSHAAFEYERTRNDLDARSDNEVVRRAFIAGAKWQKQHDAELIEIAYNDGITIGMTKQKEQMMKEAVEGEITKDNRGNNVVRTGVFNNGFEIGDKVCIIIVKE